MGWQVLKNFTESFPTLNLPWNLAHFQMHTSYAHLSFETCSLSAYGTMPLATNTPTICTPVALRVLLMSLTDKLSYNILHTSNTHVYRPPILWVIHYYTTRRPSVHQWRCGYSSRHWLTSCHTASYTHHTHTYIHCVYCELFTIKQQTCGPSVHQWNCGYSSCHWLTSYHTASYDMLGWLDSRVVSMLDSGIEGPGFKSQSWCCRVTVLGKLLTPIVPLFTKQQKLVAALLRVAGVTAGLAESNGSLPPGWWLTSPPDWLPRSGISSGMLHSVIEYGLPLPFSFLSYIHTSMVIAKVLR